VAALERPLGEPLRGAAGASAPDWGDVAAHHSGWAWARDSMRLSDAELDILLIALAPEADLRYERLYGYLQDDVSRRRPTVDLVLNLISTSAAEKLAHRVLFAADGRLLRLRLIRLTADDRTSLAPLLAHVVAGAATFGGSVAIGPLAGPAARPLQVEGSEVHSGGSDGGFSFADRSVGAFVQEPNAGQRWVWYAQDGIARLNSGTDLLTVSPTIEGGGLDVSRRMRVRQGKDASAGIWLLQSGPNADRAFIGMGGDDQVGFYGASGTGWGLAMNTGNGSVGIGIGLTPPAGRLHVDGFIAIRASGAPRPPHRSGPFGPVPFLTGVGVDASGAIGIRASGDLWAGEFDGDVSISGTLSKGGGGFTIDHPLDPGQKYLSHSFVESPDMLNVYAGTVTTGADGLAEIELPAYFEALNQDPTYQLTPIGTPVAVSVAEEVSGNRFTIRSEPGGVRVCWLVTGVRHDRWAEEHRIVPEHQKPETAADRYLHPLLHGAPAEQGIFSRPESVPGPASYPASEPVEG
jgi:hypothetical protein